MVNQRLIWSASVCITLALIGALTVLSGPFWPGHEVCRPRKRIPCSLSQDLHARQHMACSLRSFSTVSVCIHRLLNSHLLWFYTQSLSSSRPNWRDWHISSLNRHCTAECSAPAPCLRTQSRDRSCRHGTVFATSPRSPEPVLSGRSWRSCSSPCQRHDFARVHHRVETRPGCATASNSSL